MTTLYRIAGVILLFFSALTAVYFLHTRPLDRRWGATAAEQRMPLPGDELIPPGSDVTTRAIAIHAPPAVVWPWLVQIGQQKAGFYSYDWLENLFAANMPDVKKIVPDWQQPAVGDPVSLQQHGLAPKIVLLERDSLLVLELGYIFYLKPIGADSTRLVVRYPFPLPTLFDRAYYYPIFEPAHFIMESGMMLGLKRRAERSFDVRNYRPDDRERSGLAAACSPE